MSPTSTFLDPVVGKTPWEETTVAVGVGVLTMLAAAALFAGALRIRPWSAYAPWAQRLLEHKYYFDEIYDAVFVRPMDWVAGFALRDVEKPVIDGVVIDTGALTQASASGLSLTQSGYFRNYVLVFVGGAVIVAVILIVRASS
jgi:NADH-quinone oxidoreductase subunit L